MMVKKLLGVALALILLTYSFSLVDFGEFFKVILDADLWLLLWIYPIVFIVVILKSFRLKKILNILHEDYDLSGLTQIFTIGFFLGVLTPGRVGDFSRALYLKDKVPLGKGGVAIFLDRVIDVFILLILGGTSITLFFIFFQQIVFPLEILSLLIILVVLGFLFMINLNKFEFVITFILQFLPESLKGFIKTAYSHFNEATSYIKNDYSKLLVPLILGLIIWIVDFLIAFVIIFAFGIDVPFFFIFILMPIFTLAEVLPISISGLGTREVASIFIFSFFGIPPEQAVAFAITFFLSIYPVLTLIGFYFSLRRKVDFSLEVR